MIANVYVSAIDLQLPPLFCYLMAWHVGNAIVGIDTLLNTSCQTLLTLLDHVRTKYSWLFPDEATVGLKKIVHSIFYRRLW